MVVTLFPESNGEASTIVLGQFICVGDCHPGYDHPETTFKPLSIA